MWTSGAIRFRRRQRGETGDRLGGATGDQMLERGLERRDRCLIGELEVIAAQ
jgi:hypothetical protein